MTAKQAYKEAYRVARLLNGMYATLAEQLDYINRFQWGFSVDMFLNAHNAFTVTGRRAA